MATAVTQYSSPDPSLIQNPNFGQFAQYLITGTSYILDNKAQILYEFNPAVPGVLEATNGSYAQFLSFLAANPVTSVLPNPNGPPGSPATFGFPYNFQSVPALPGNNLSSVYDTNLREILENILLEVRAMRLATVSLALQGNMAVETDFDPMINAGFSGAEPTLFN